MELFSFFLFIVMVVVFSAIVSGSEAALLSLSVAKVKEFQNESNGKSSAANRLLKIKENIQKYITTIVIFNNIINIVGSIYVGVLASELFGEVYLGLVSGILTFLIILFSEIVPKIYGEKYSGKISLIVANPLYFLTILLSPLVFVMEKLTSLFVKGERVTQISEGEIREMAAMGKEEGSVTSYESDVIENVFKMNDLEVYDIMTPKTKVVSVTKGFKFQEVLELAAQSGFTRFPVLSKDGVVLGILNIKDLFKFFGKENEFRVSKLMRPVIFAPETMKVSTLEEKIKKQRSHLAAIVNEHGDFTGIVTLEDVIEEILGDIEDEFDAEAEDEIKEISLNKYHINAAVDIEEINDELGLDLAVTESYSTLNGFLVSKLDEIPKINDAFQIEQGVFRVIKRTKRKVTLVEFVKFSEEEK